jgi:hypothetical protein
MGFLEGIGVPVLYIGLYMFRTLLAHPQEALYKRFLVFCVLVMTVDFIRGLFCLTPF